MSDHWLRDFTKTEAGTLLALVLWPLVLLILAVELVLRVFRDVRRVPAQEQTAAMNERWRLQKVIAEYDALPPDAVESKVRVLVRAGWTEESARRTIATVKAETKS